MKQLADNLGILPLVRKQTGLQARAAIQKQAEFKPKQNSTKDVLNKEELRLLVKILKAIGHSCEHQNISIQQGITHYQLNKTLLIFDDVTKTDQQHQRHLSPLSLMLDDPEQKRPTWEKLKNLADS